MTDLSDLFDELDDPRAANASHRLGDVIVLMIAANLCGQTTATEMALFADLRKPALNRIVAYDRPPSHDTFSRLLRLIDPEAFAALFARFAAAFSTAFAAAAAQAGGPETVALDGKALRRAYEAGRAHAPPMMVSVFAAETGLTLAAKAGPSEAEAAKTIIELLDLTGKIVTADALHASHDIARALVGAGAGYALALKRNRPDWRAEAEAAFADADPETAVEAGRAHGRDERREAAVLPVATPRAAGHEAYGRVVSQRGDAPPMTRYFLLSESFAPADLLAIIRGHWRIENSLHWVLDVHLGEDLDRARKDNAPANAALLRRLARNILQIADKPKVPISHRIRKCMWSDDFMINAIAHMR